MAFQGVTDMRHGSSQHVATVTAHADQCQDFIGAWQWIASQPAVGHQHAMHCAKALI